MARKPRSDAKLKTLPPATQAKIYELCRTMGYGEVKSAVLEQFKVETSTGALCEFNAWYPVSRHLEQARDFADQLNRDLAANPKLQLESEKLSEIAQVAFEIRAMQEQDAKLYMGLRKLRQKDREATLNERRVALLEKKAAQADKAKEVTDNNNLTEAEKLARYRQIFGGG